MKCGIFITFLSGFAVLCYENTYSYAATDRIDCLKECGKSSSCIAVKTGNGTCDLLTMVRNAVDAMECQYFIKKERTVDIPGRSLTPLQQILQNAIYATQEACPEGWTDDGSVCSLAGVESDCAGYAAFLEVSFDGKKCVIPRQTVTYSCPSSKFTVKGFFNGYFCYAMILRGELNGTIETMNDFCYEETGCYLASIHSEAENEFIASLRNSSLLNNSVIIGLESINGQVENATDFQWLDRTVLDYDNFENTSAFTEGMYVFPYPIMSKFNKWLTYSSTSPLAFSMISKSMICKCDASAKYS